MTPSRASRGASLRPLLVALVMSVALCAPAAADASAWVAHQSVPVVNNRTGQPPAPQIGADAAGNAILAMLVDKGPPQYVQLAARPVGSGWDAATELGSVTVNTGGPALAVDPAGNGLIAFVNSDGHLWGSGEGAFRTVCRFSSATVRGTTWLTDDHCNGTLTKVTTGKVGVRDFVLRTTIVVKEGKSYFARPAPKTR